MVNPFEPIIRFLRLMAYRTYHSSARYLRFAYDCICWDPVLETGKRYGTASNHPSTEYGFRRLVCYLSRRNILLAYLLSVSKLIFWT